MKSFSTALDLARRDRDRTNEFSALEHLVMLKMDLGEYSEAKPLAEELILIGEKLRAGSEAPFARALLEVIQHGLGSSSTQRMNSALDELAQCDAKNRMAYVLTRAACIDFRNGASEVAAARARQAFEAAEKINRASEIAIAAALLSRCAAGPDWREKRATQIQALRQDGFRGVSAHARKVVEALTENLDIKTGGSHGTRSRRANVSGTDRPETTA